MRAPDLIIQQQLTPRPALSVSLAGLAVALLLLSLAAGQVDPRLINGVPVWAKPAKFAVSFVVLFATLAWLEARLSEPWRKGVLVQGTVGVMAFCMIAEMGYIMMQAGLGEASHFNQSTPFHSFMYTVVMAFGAVLLVVGVGIYGYVAWADKEAKLTPALRLGTVLGFGLSSVLTLFIAGYIGGQSSALVGTPSVDHPTVPVMGWSAEVGDLRPAHFLALHAMQVLPFLGFLLDRWHTPGHRWLLILGAFVYTLVTTLAFHQARSGQPLITL